MTMMALTVTLARLTWERGSQQTREADQRNGSDLLHGHDLSPLRRITRRIEARRLGAGRDCKAHARSTFRLGPQVERGMAIELVRRWFNQPEDRQGLGLTMPPSLLLLRADQVIE